MNNESKQSHSVSVAEAISSFVATTEMMHEMAERSEWEQLAEMEAKRGPELEAFLSSLDSNALQTNSELLKQSIEKIIDLDKQVVVLAEESKNNLAELMQKSSLTRQAMSEYQKNTEL